MKMTANNLFYKGYEGSVEVSFEDNCLYGRVLNIQHLLSYEGATPKELVESFEDAVDCLVDYCLVD